MLANKWFHFALGALSWLLFLGLYVTARFGNRDVRQWRIPLVSFMFVVFGIWAVCFATDHDSIGFIFQFNFYGLFLAALWIKWRYRSNGKSTELNIFSRGE